MRSTYTATKETSLHWERTGGAHAGFAAQYGDWTFRVYKWQPGSYLAIAVNQKTGETLQHGRLAKEIGNLIGAKFFCERIYERLRLEDLRNGIERE